MVRWLHALFIVLALALLTAVSYRSLNPGAGGTPMASRGAMPPGHPQTGKQDPSDVLSPVPQNRPAPAFAAAGRDGKPKSLASFAGQHVLLNFWATWCEPCRDELPHLANMARALEGAGVRLVLVSVDKAWSDVDALATAMEKEAPAGAEGQPWRDAAAMLRDGLPQVINLLDPDAGIPKSFGTLKFPETFLISPTGRIRTHFVGPKSWSHPQALKYILQSIQGQQAPDQARMPPDHPPIGAPAAKPQN